MRIRLPYRLNNLKWWILHRFHPRHQYNRIRIPSLKPDYHDPDRRIIHATFDIVSEYADHLRGDGINGTRWHQEEIDNSQWPENLLEQIEKETKVIALAEWWKNHLKEKDYNEENFVSLEKDEEFSQAETEKLKEVADIIHFMWYP
jgi:hypothetical protein